jgi:hypothetical protein
MAAGVFNPLEWEKYIEQTAKTLVVSHRGVHVDLHAARNAIAISAFFTDATPGQTWRIEASVVYDASLLAPALWFSVVDADGCIPASDAVTKWMQSNTEAGLPGVTRDWHPISRVPAFTMHTCHAREWIREACLGKLGEAPLWLWLNIYLPFLGLQTQRK